MSVSTFVVLCALAWIAPEGPVADPTPLGIPFQRYTVKDSFNRVITFYLSQVSKEDKTEPPLVLWIQGSGCQSLFRKHGDRIGGGLETLLLQQGKGRVRVLVVEKPGVRFLDAPARPGSAEGASEEFLKEHTLERWAEANVAALKGARVLPGVDRSRTLVAGHSEGGIIAARVAAQVPEVTHVASLAGGGPTQLFDLAELRAQPTPDDKSGDADNRRRQVLNEWAAIQHDPESISKFWMGHTYRRWSSFLSHSVADELRQSKCKIFLAQGTSDASVAVKAHDVLLAELLARGRDVTPERIEGADHGFRTADMASGSPAGMQSLFGRLVTWYLSNESP